WGAFLADGAGKDEFLGEYTGDLITQAEADRRGRVYDQMNNSYLFDLNEQWVLDARYRGNKMRCANHSAQPNCKVGASTPCVIILSSLAKDVQTEMQHML
ncbi:enhancer of zeste, partial [Haematococcus lacustris]